MGRTVSRMARSASRPVGFILLTVLTIVFSACTTPEIIRETPQPSPTATPTPTTESVGTPVEATTTATLNQPQMQINRITLATRVSNTGAPQDERSSIPELAESFYLCVEVRNVQSGSRFQADWFEDGQMIGRSEKLALEDASEPIWISLRYQPVSKLNPAREHAVQLSVDDRPVERLAFRVGVGDAADAIAAAAFTTGFDKLEKPSTRKHDSMLTRRN